MRIELVIKPPGGGRGSSSGQQWSVQNLSNNEKMANILIGLAAQHSQQHKHQQSTHAINDSRYNFKNTHQRRY